MENLPGEAFDLPLVNHVGAVSSHSAERSQTWHMHDGFELLFVLSGATAWEFRRGGRIGISGGHFMVIPPKAVHRVEYAMRKPSRVCGLTFNPASREGQKNTAFTRLDLRHLNRRFTESAFVVAAMSDELESRVRRLGATKQALEREPKNPILRASMRTLICSILLEAAGELVPSESAHPAALLVAARKFLSRHLREPVKMSELVKHMGFSRSHFFSLFKSAAGMTPNDYYLRLRVEAAQRLLADTRASITDAAMESGFSSSQYFSSVFKKYTGQSPAEYRRKLGAGI